MKIKNNVQIINHLEIIHPLPIQNEKNQTKQTTPIKSISMETHFFLNRCIKMLNDIISIFVVEFLSFSFSIFHYQLFFFYKYCNFFCQINLISCCSTFLFVNFFLHCFYRSLNKFLCVCDIDKMLHIIYAFCEKIRQKNEHKNARKKNIDQN